MSVLASHQGLRRLVLPQPSQAEALALLDVLPNEAALDDDRFAGLIDCLRLYFSGKAVSFADELDMASATPFQQDVWRMTRAIPFGQTLELVFPLAR